MLPVRDQTQHMLLAWCLQNMVHRDIKPENILMTARKAIKLADFGLSIDCSEWPGLAAACSVFCKLYCVSAVATSARFAAPAACKLSRPVRSHHQSLHVPGRSPEPLLLRPCRCS